MATTKDKLRDLADRELALVERFHIQGDESARDEYAQIEIERHQLETEQRLAQQGVELLERKKAEEEEAQRIAHLRLNERELRSRARKYKKAAADIEIKLTELIRAIRGAQDLIEPMSENARTLGVRFDKFGLMTVISGSVNHGLWTVFPTDFPGGSYYTQPLGEQAAARVQGLIDIKEG